MPVASRGSNEREIKKRWSASVQMTKYVKVLGLNSDTSGGRYRATWAYTLAFHPNMDGLDLIPLHPMMVALDIAPNFWNPRDRENRHLDMVELTDALRTFSNMGSGFIRVGLGSSLHVFARFRDHEHNLEVSKEMAFSGEGAKMSMLFSSDLQIPLVNSGAPMFDVMASMAVAPHLRESFAPAVDLDELPRDDRRENGADWVRNLDLVMLQIMDPEHAAELWRGGMTQDRYVTLRKNGISPEDILSMPDTPDHWITAWQS